MLKIEINKESNLLIENQLYLVLEDDFTELSKDLDLISIEMEINVKKNLEANKFTGKVNQSVLLISSDKSCSKKIFFIGIGKLNQTLNENLEAVRNGIGIGINKALSLDWLSCSIKAFLPDKQDNIVWKNWLADFVTTCHLSAYKFDDYKTKQKSNRLPLALNILVPTSCDANIEKALFEGNVMGHSVNFTRNLANQPPNIAHPEYIAEKAKLAAKEFGFQCNVFNKSDIEQMKMGGILAVGSGSTKECKFVELKIKAKKDSNRTIILIGKGVTFDTGGVSLKPAKNMCNMKFDMSGAAAVLGSFIALAQLETTVNIIGLMPLVENMPDGGSYRQDDIITHYDGTTTEVDNTDAEGRLILADSIAYAEDKYQPEIIVDIATLTGACVVALGHFFTGMMSNDKNISTIMETTGELCGEPVWLLPSISLYDRAIESKVADIVNTGRSGFDAGAITAGMFLKRFIKKASWIHLDIAGTECDLPINNYLGRGSTGVGVRLLTSFIQSL